MAALLAALVCAYMAVSGMDTADDGSETDAQTEISVNQISQSSITSISYTTGGEERTFTLSGERWIYAQDETFPVSTTALSDIASALSGILAERAIEGDTESAEYGLDRPAHVIRVGLSAGGTLVYRIGDYNKHTDTYYMTAEGHDRIYMVRAAFGKLFEGELYDLLECESLPSISTENINKITAEIGGARITLEKKTEDESVVWTHTNREGGEAVLEQESVDKILTALTQQKLSVCVEHNATDENLAQYGLDAASREKITVSYDVKIEAGTSETSLGGETTVSRELVYYIGRVDVPVSDTTDTAADTTASTDTTAQDTTASAESGATTEDSTTTEDGTTSAAERKTYLSLDGSRMVYEVSISGADVFFE